jgi:hypothetical protein
MTSVRGFSGLASAGLIALTILCTSAAVADEPVTVKLGGGWIALGVGATWGDGVLSLGGNDYPFSIKGVSIGDFGAAGFTASGTVHDLECADDFNGQYTNITGGPTILGDRSRVTVRNEKGVTIDLVIATPGVLVSFGRSGIAIDIPSRPLATAACRSTRPTSRPSGIS